MIGTAVDFIRNVDTFAAIDFLSKERDPFSITESFNDLVRFLYWEEKDLPNVVAIGRAGIQYGLAAASAASEYDRDAAVKIREKVRALAFNVASFTWPGWAEPGIDPNLTDVTLGYDAAKLGVRLIEEMDAGALALSRAFWMLGAFQLHAGRSMRAIESFDASAGYAKEADSEEDRLLNLAYGFLARAQADPQTHDVSEDYKLVLAEMAELEHGEELISQLETAAEVMGIPI